MSAAGAWSMQKGASQLRSSGRGGSAYYRIPRRHGAAFPLESELLREGLPQLERPGRVVCVSLPEQYVNVERREMKRLLVAKVCRGDQHGAKKQR